MSQDVDRRISHTDIDLMRSRLKLTPGQRLQAMFDAHALLVGIMRGRLRARYPQLSESDLNIKVIEEIERVKRLPSRPHAVSRHST